MAGHSPYYSHRTMWRTAVNVFNETKKSGVHLDFKTYHAIMQSMSVHRHKKDAPGIKLRPKRRQVEPAAVNISAVPSLGLWKPVHKPSEAPPKATSVGEVAGPQDLSLGEAPRPLKPQSLITTLREADLTQTTQSTPPLFDNVPFFRRPAEESPHVVSIEHAFGQGSSSKTENLKLDIPGIVHSIQQAKQRFFTLHHEEDTEVLKAAAPRAEPYEKTSPYESLSVVDISGAQAASSLEAASHATTPAPSESRVIDTTFAEKPSERHRTSLSIEDLPADGPTAAAPAAEPYLDETPATPDLEELTSQWERRREAEAREQDRLAAIEFEREEKRRQLEALRVKNDEWAEQRGSMHSLAPMQAALDRTAYEIAFHPQDDRAEAAFASAKTSENVSAKHVRAVLRRLSNHHKLDELSSFLSEISTAPIEGVDASLMHYNLILQYQTGGYSQVSEIFSAMERRRAPIHRRCVGLAMLASVRGDSSAGWQRAVEIFESHKPATHDPLCLLELNAINALSEANVRSRDIRLRVLELLRKIHAQLRDSMNQIGKQHSTALIRAYVKAGDAATAQAILKGYQASGEADQTMYANVLSSLSDEAIQEVLGTFLDGREAIEAELVAAAMFAYANRSATHAAWAVLGKARAHKGFIPRGRRLAAAVLHCIEAEGDSTEAHVGIAHRVLAASDAYSDRFFQRMMPYFQRFSMDAALIEAMQSMRKVFQRAVAPAHIAAYQQACEAANVSYSADSGLDTEKAPNGENAENIEKAEKTQNFSKLDDSAEKSTFTNLAADFDNKLMHLAKCGDWQGATAIVSEMGARRMRLSTFQYNCVLTAAKEHRAVLDDTLKHMADFHVKANTVTVNLAMHAYSRLRHHDRARHIYEKAEASTRDATTYHLALDACIPSANGWESAIGVFQEMKQRNIKPTQRAFDAVLECTTTGSWEHAFKVMQLAKPAKGVELSNAQKEALKVEMVSKGVEGAEERIAGLAAGKKKATKGKKK